MMCDYCKKDFPEKKLQESHDVPCYLFLGNRTLQKQKADKFSRHWLCAGEETNKCHERCEGYLRLILQTTASLFGEEYFKKEGDNDTRTTSG